MNNINVMGMVAHDADCIRKILGGIIAQLKKVHEKPRYGLENAYTSFIVMNFLQDVSVFAYEMLKTSTEMRDAFMQDVTDGNFFEDLKKVRNAIHIHNSSGSFAPRAKKIKDAIEARFPDGHFNLCLAYRIDTPNAALLSSDAFIFHMTSEIENKEHFLGEGASGYSGNIMAIMNTYVAGFPIDEISYLKPSLNLPTLKNLQIESFNYTINALHEKTQLSDPSAMRVVLMHTYVSFMNILFELISADALVEASEYWLFFLAKLYAIRYDEVMDSFDNLNKHCIDDDKVIIAELLDFKGFDRKEVVRGFAQKLRNSIHYSVPNCPPIYKDDKNLVDLERVYLSTVSVNSVHDFRELYYAMRFDMKMMQLRFRRLFDLDCTLEQLPIKMARGGKVLPSNHEEADHGV